MLYDLHVHTKYSYDGVHTPEKIVKEADKIGLDGLAFTDHMNVDSWKDIPKLKKKYKLDIIKGQEIIVTENSLFAGEVIGIYMKKPILEVLDMKDCIKELRKQKALIIIPHPFKSKFKNLKKYDFDALETLNGRRTLAMYQMKYGIDLNKKAHKFAKEYKFAEVGGSDAHTYFEIGTGVTDTGKLSLRNAILQHKTKTLIARKNKKIKQFGINVVRVWEARKNQSKNPFIKVRGS